MHPDIVTWFQDIGPHFIYLTIALIVGIESLGIPVPGEIALMTAALLASQGAGDPMFIWFAGSVGAIVGDSIGYELGHHYGRRLLTKFEKWFPRHINKDTIRIAEKMFALHGTKVVFFGRFVALLRIFAGPLAGILRLPYHKFLLANVPGGILWSGLVVWSVYYLGVVAEHWFKRLSWVALIIVIIFGVILSTVLRKKMNAYLKKEANTTKKP